MFGSQKVYTMQVSSLIISLLLVFSTAAVQSSAKQSTSAERFNRLTHFEILSNGEFQISNLADSVKLYLADLKINGPNDRHWEGVFSTECRSHLQLWGDNLVEIWAIESK